MEMKAGEFKAKCLKIMEQVKEYHTEVTITKHGKPIAKLVPISDRDRPELFGIMAGQVTLKDDITQPVDEKWSADE